MEGNCSSSAGLFQSPAISSSVGTPAGRGQALVDAATEESSPRPLKGAATASRTATALKNAFPAMKCVLGGVTIGGGMVVICFNVCTYCGGQNLRRPGCG